MDRGWLARRAGLLVVLASVASGAAQAENRALIITNAEYRSDAVLAGVKKDRETAFEIARLLGVPPSNILRGNDLDVEGMRAAFKRLLAAVKPNDSVFVYYSGHGTRFDSPTRPGVCAEALVPVSGRQLLEDVELEGYIRQLSQRSKRLIVMADSCHSGGVLANVRSLNVGGVRPKMTRRDDSRSCSQPTNVMATQMRSLQAATPGGANFVYVAASRAEEVSWDTDAGGLVTLSWFDCLRQGADLDGSGTASVAELRTCAQARNDRVQIPGGKPSTITVLGNAEIPFRFDRAAPPPAAPSGSAAPVPATPVSPAPPGATAPPSAAPVAGPGPAQPATPAAPDAVLKDLFNNRDTRLPLELGANQRSFRIGSDVLRLQVRSPQAGYLYILSAGSSGKTVDLLFPNQRDLDNRIGAGESLAVPRVATYQLKPGGPAGRNTIVAIVTSQPHPGIAGYMRNAKMFAAWQAATREHKVQASDDLLSTCGGRDFAAEDCAGYAAAMLQVDEVAR